VLVFAWYKRCTAVPDHPLISEAEIEYIERAAALINIDRSAGAKAASRPLTWDGVAQLLQQRMLVGSTLGSSASRRSPTSSYMVSGCTWCRPAHVGVEGRLWPWRCLRLCGSVGGVLGGMCSDALLRRGHSLTFARKSPIIAGMLLSVDDESRATTRTYRRR